MKKLLQKLDTIGLLLLIAAFIWYSVTNIMSAWNIGLAIAGGLCIVGGIAVNYRQILASLGKRSTKYAGNYIISLLLVIAVVSGLNYLGQKHPERFDLTAGGQFTLAPQTVKVLENLDQDIEIKAFPELGQDKSLEGLLREYRTINSRVRYELINPDKQPGIARQYQIEAYGTLIVVCGDRKEKIDKRSGEVQEEDLTNAIIKVLRTDIPKIYLIQGHGEKDPANSEQYGYSKAKQAMEDQGYLVESLNLVETGQVPEDAQVLILAGPETEPFSQELDLISDYLNNGGGALILVDPKPSPSLADYLSNWGVEVDDNLVLDVSGVGRLFGMGPHIPLVNSYDNHPITEGFEGTMTFFPQTRSIRPLENLPEGITVEKLCESNPNSWGESDLDTPEADFDPGKDLNGPLPLAVAVTKEIKPATEETSAVNARLVVAGTSLFPIDAYFDVQRNGDLFMNMVSWLAQDDDLISIRPKDPEDRRIVLTQSQGTLIQWILLVILPGIVLVAGIIVVMNRRRR
ncbi:MAG: Gldg family protein [Acidobacteriota bacterium]